jgi:hypothetical protein
MARRLLAGILVAAAFGPVGSAAGQQVPILLSAKVVHGHPVVEIWLTDARPIEFLAAKKRTADPNGALLGKNVRLRETIDVASSSNGIVRWQSPRALRRGTWFVQVTTVATGGVTDCPPKTTKCGLDFSNVRRVVVRKSS